MKHLQADASTEHGGDRGRPPVIAIVGRPNAGKSTLFNRLARTRRALVDAMPGVTRDRNITEATHHGRRYLVVDTGGFEADATAGIEAEVRAQSELAMAEADAIVFVLDGRAGLAPADRGLVDRLRRAGKPVWVAVNKLDTPALDFDAAEFFALGLARVVPISAAHGRNVEALLDDVLALVGGAESPSEIQTQATGVAIIGRPNVGKSSLLNRLVGYERAIVTPVAGTTRDAIDTPFRFRNREFMLVDTAGVRRRPRVREHIERASVVRAFRALERAQVGVLVLDAVEGMTDQDARLAAQAWEQGRALVLVMNKWDLAGRGRGAAAKVEAEVRRRYPFLDDVPLLFVSAATGKGMDAVMPAVALAAENHCRELQTSQLNQVLQAALRAASPPTVRGRRPTFQYAVQTGVRPPTVTVFCSAPELVAEAYTRFLLNRLREVFALSGTPVRIRYRRRERRGAG